MSWIEFFPAREALLRLGPPEPLVVLGHAIGPFTIRYYALAYILALVIGWRVVRRLVRLRPPVATELQVDEFLTWATLGVVLGGRIGYVMFYMLFFQQDRLAEDPFSVFRVWDGGMSFHGGMLGVAVAIVLFCRREAIPVLGFADRIAVVAPIGLGLGRLANFVNGELWGREAPSWLPWSMVFEHDPLHLQRHPSQLYQALLEGLVLFAVLALLARVEAIRARFGLLTGVFLTGYACARITGELFREPDKPLGFFLGGVTMGQLLSVPMLLAGLWLIARTRARTRVLAG